MIQMTRGAFDMKERPIIFSAPMVRAILAGKKTQTRRVVKPQPPEILAAYAPKVYWPARDRHMTHGDPDGAAYLQFERPGDYDGAHVMRGGFGFRCPYGQPGDRLWVRETFAIVPRTAYRCSRGVQQVLRPDDDHDAAIYRAGWDRSNGGFRWRPSVHMPGWASRITLEVTGVRVERLQKISEADAIAEGVTAGKYRGLERAVALTYSDLWEQMHGPSSWAANPWVWVVEFKRLPA
jgi:hypothetical protein